MIKFTHPTQKLILLIIALTLLCSSIEGSAIEGPIEKDGISVSIAQAGNGPNLSLLSPVEITSQINYEVNTDNYKLQQFAYCVSMVCRLNPDLTTITYETIVNKANPILPWIIIPTEVSVTSHIPYQIKSVSSTHKPTISNSFQGTALITTIYNSSNLIDGKNLFNDDGSIYSPADLVIADQISYIIQLTNNATVYSTSFTVVPETTTSYRLTFNILAREEWRKDVGTPPEDNSPLASIPGFNLGFMAIFGIGIIAILIHKTKLIVN